MMGLSPEVLTELKSVLRVCGPLNSTATLKAAFTDERIHRWVTSVPEVDNLEERIQLLIHRLQERRSKEGQNALVSFLLVARDNVTEGDACREQLDRLAGLVATELGQEKGALLPPRQKYRWGFISGGALLVLLIIAGLWLRNKRSAAVSSCPAPPVYASELNLDEKEVRVEAALLRMGDDQPGSPAHDVPVPAFLIDRYEVTNLQYWQFIQATDHAELPLSWPDDSFPTGEAYYPVTDVEWKDAADYCAWAGKRLPFEDEWELACRGSTGNLYPWGNRAGVGLANTRESTCGRPVTVGSFPRGNTAEGIADLIGNVAEWTGSLYDNYPYRAEDGREAVDVTSDRVLRGGSFQLSLAQPLTCSHRLIAPPSTVDVDIGFRCARDMP